MSSLHVYQLKKVQSEYDAIRVAVGLTAYNWYRLDAPKTPENKKQEHLLSLFYSMAFQSFKRSTSEETLQNIFIIRLFAVFEGILKEHHSDKHTGDPTPLHASVSWYIDRLAHFNRHRISVELVAKVHEIRQYRNSLVHSLPNVQPYIFADALANLSKFVFKLPDV